ncbi:MAG TPA: hypothetical protein VI299_16180 [Polyangiales bacterium]
MVSLKTVHCPRCGAAVRLDEKRERATCDYCGTTAYAEHASVAGAPTVVVKAHPTVMVSLALGLLSVIVAALALMKEDKPVSPAAPPVPVIAAPVALPQPPAARPPQPAPPSWRFDSYRPAQLVELEGANALLVPVEQTAPVRSAHFALYALPSGTLLRKTVALEDPQRALIAVLERRLFLANARGQLEAYDLASGNLQWSSALGERVAALCDASPALQVTTDDGRNLSVDVTTGRQSPTRTPCKVPLAVAPGRNAPADRRDYRAPRDVQAFRCGSVRVMGSANYVVPDACKQYAKIDSDHLPGMVGHAAWRFGRGALVFGVRTPGTYVPMVGLYERGRWTWQSEVPASNPLEAETGGPRMVSLFEDSLLIGYASGQPKQHWLTRFDARTGRRSWNRALASHELTTIVQNAEVVVVHSGSTVELIAPSDGTKLTSLDAS